MTNSGEYIIMLSVLNHINLQKEAGCIMYVYAYRQNVFNLILSL